LLALTALFALYLASPLLSHVCDADPVTTGVFPRSLPDALPILYAAAVGPRPSARSRHAVARCGRNANPEVIPASGESSRPESPRSEEHTSELQSRVDLVCRLLLEKKKSLSRTVKERARRTASEH